MMVAKAMEVQKLCGDMATEVKSLLVMSNQRANQMSIPH
jgi:hypothetical protein